MKSFILTVALAIFARLFMGNFQFSLNDILLTLFIGGLFITPAVYSLVSGKVFIAGGEHTAADSPLVFYPVQCFSAFVGSLVMLLPLNVGIFELGLRQV